MKGQSEILVFILLFLLSISMFVTTIFWSKGILQQNMYTAKITSAEKAAKELDEGIKSIVRFDGMEEIDYGVDGPITLLNSSTIEIRTIASSDVTSVPKYWSNLTSDHSYIREMLDGDLFRVQIIYPEGSEKIVLFTDGPTLSKPKIIRLEKNSTVVENSKPTIRIRITFV
jgi:hypothetical protein